MDLFVSRNYATHLVQLSDEEFERTRPRDEDESSVYNAEWRKRKKAKEAEKQWIAQETAERIKKHKDALQYTEAFATEICERISAGELLTMICLDEHMPTVRRCDQWLRSHQDFKILYDEALRDRLAIFEEQLIQIPDEAARDVQIVKKGNSERRILDPARITAAKLRVEVRRLHLKAGNPAKWGDTSTLITKSADPDDLSNLSAEELERRIADLEAKNASVRRVA